MTEAQALHWTIIGIGAIAVIQAAEFLIVQRRLRQVWPLQGAALIECVRLGAGLATPFATFPALVVIAACHACTLVRFRGTYNGGSDALYLHLLIGTFVSIFTYIHYGLRYIAAVLIYSYASSGLRKLRQKSWRDGSALRTFLRSDHYLPDAATGFLARYSTAASWAVILFEISFPLSLWQPHAYIGAGVLFHLGNSYTFGLNRFLWVWVCAYPALNYCANAT